MIQSASQPSATSSRDPILAELFDEITKRLQAGEPVNIESYIARHPDWADELRGVLPAIEILVELGRSAASQAVSVSDASAESVQELGTLGDFRILREIGRGGMGIVYEAEQLSIGRRVALKVLPFAAVMDSRQLQRFKNEVHAAGQIHHTNIVPIFFVGSERGVHFYAMQFIDGQTLAEVIRELRVAAGRDSANESQREKADSVIGDQMIGHRLEDEATRLAEHRSPITDHRSPLSPPSTSPLAALTTERSTDSPEYFRSVAQLGIQAAEALDHAHQLGIIHRDIKPSNLLFDVRGNLWITDFGLARLPSDVNLTMTGDVLGTLRYMSPEQALGNRVLLDHRTDIYSLGLTLYELLTLEPAFGGNDRQEVLHQIAFDEPTPPRNCHQSVPIELQTILLKAIAKNADDRYHTAEQLADDLRRFVENKPILAKPPSVFKRFGKWSRRHRPLVRLAILFLVLAVVGLATSTALIWQANQRIRTEQEHTKAALIRAEEKTKWARRAVDEMYTKVAEEWLEDAPRMTNLQREFLGRAASFYEELTQETGDDPSVRFETARAFHRLALLRGHEPDKAPAEYDKAVVILDQLTDQFPEVPQFREELATCYHHWGAQLRRLDRLQEAEPPLRRGLAISTQLSRLFPSEFGYQYEAATAHNDLAELLRIDGRPLEAEAEYRAALELYGGLVTKRPDERRYQSGLATTCHDLAYLLIPLGELIEAEELIRRAMTLFQDLLTVYPASQSLRLGLGITHGRLVDLLLVTDRLQEAEETINRALVLRERMFADYPTEPYTWGGLAETYNRLGRVLLRANRCSEAATAFGRAIEYREMMVAQYPTSQSQRDELAIVLSSYARLLATANDAGVRDLDQANELAKRAVELDPASGNSWAALGLAHYQSGDFAAASAELGQAERLPRFPSEFDAADLRKTFVAAKTQFLELQIGAARTADLFRLAVAYFRRGETEKSRLCHVQANNWMEKNKANEELSRLRDETKALLKVQDRN